MSEDRIQLGDVAKDRFTGFEGTVVAKVEFLNGLIRCEIQPRLLVEGRMVASEYVDIYRLEVIPQSKRAGF